MKYYSEVLKKNFDTVEDLEAAEAEESKKNALVSKEKEERQKDVTLVQEAANAYLTLIRKNNEERKALKLEEEKAYDVYRKQLAEFSKKHKNYHLSYRSDGKNVEFEVEENRYMSVQEYMQHQHSIVKKMMEEFFKPW